MKTASFQPTFSYSKCAIPHASSGNLRAFRTELRIKPSKATRHHAGKPHIDIAQNLRLRILVAIIVSWKGIIVAEHIKMTAQEAKQKAEAFRKVILDTYHRVVQPSPFFTDLRAGTLSRSRLQGWIKNWYSFAIEVYIG